MTNELDYQIVKDLRENFCKKVTDPAIKLAPSAGLDIKGANPPKQMKKDKIDGVPVYEYFLNRGGSPAIAGNQRPTWQGRTMMKCYAVVENVGGIFLERSLVNNTKEVTLSTYAPDEHKKDRIIKEVFICSSIELFSFGGPRQESTYAVVLLEGDSKKSVSSVEEVGGDSSGQIGIDW